MEWESHPNVRYGAIERERENDFRVWAFNDECLPFLASTLSLFSSLLESSTCILRLRVNILFNPIYADLANLHFYHDISTQHSQQRSLPTEEEEKKGDFDKRLHGQHSAISPVHSAWGIPN